MSIPLYTTLHASKPKEIIRFKYLFQEEIEEEYKFFLVIEEDTNYYSWFEPTEAENSENKDKLPFRWARVHNSASFGFWSILRTRFSRNSLL